MSQMSNGMVNVLDPVSPAGVAGARDVSSNLNQGADRTLKAAQIAAESAVQVAHIKSQEMIAKASLDSQKELEKSRQEHETGEHTQYQDFLATQQQAELDAKERMQKEEWTRQDKLNRDAIAARAITSKGALAVVRAGQEVEESAAKEEYGRQQKVADAKEKLAASKVMLEKVHKGEIDFGNVDMKNFVDQHAKAEQTAAEAGAQAMRYGVTRAIGLGAENQQTFSGRANEIAKGVPKWVGALGAVGDMGRTALGVAGAAIERVGDTVTNYVGSDQSRVPESTMTSAPALVMTSAIEALNTPAAQEMMQSSGVPLEEAKGVVLSMVDAAIKSTMAHQGGGTLGTKEADAAFEQAVAKAKEVVPAAFLRSMFETWGDITSDEGALKGMDAVVGGEASSNWKDTNREAMRLVSKVGWNFKHITGNPQSPAFMEDKTPDFKDIAGMVVTATAMSHSDPDAALKFLQEKVKLPPKELRELLVLGQKRLEGLPQSKDVEATIAELDKQVQALGLESTAAEKEKELKKGKRASEIGSDVTKELEGAGLAPPDNFYSDRFGR